MDQSTYQPWWYRKFRSVEMWLPSSTPSVWHSKCLWFPWRPALLVHLYSAVSKALSLGWKPGWKLTRAHIPDGLMDALDRDNNYPGWKKIILFVSFCSKFVTNVNSFCRRKQRNRDVKRAICFQFSIERIIKWMSNSGQRWNLNCQLNLRRLLTAFSLNSSIYTQQSLFDLKPWC